MASSYDAPEPSDEILEEGFDPLLFWDQHKPAILAVVGVILAGAIGFGWYELAGAHRISAAESALAAASTPEEYRKVAGDYAGTVAAGNAALLLADQLRDAKKYDEAVQVLNDFISRYPNHPLAHAGMLSLAETLELQGKKDEALSEYEQVPVKYPDSYSAPLAALATASIQKAEGKLEDARRTYENFLSQFPDSVFTNQATAEMHLLRPAAGSASASSSPSASPAPGIPGGPLPFQIPSGSGSAGGR